MECLFEQKSDIDKAITIENEKEIDIIVGKKSFVTNVLRDRLSNLKKGRFGNYILFPNGIKIKKSRQGNYKENMKYYLKYDRSEKYRSVFKIYKNDILVGIYPLSNFIKETEIEKRKRYR
jgi:hypothetical protein